MSENFLEKLENLFLFVFLHSDLSLYAKEQEEALHNGMLKREAVESVVTESQLLSPSPTTSRTEVIIQDQPPIASQQQSINEQIYQIITALEDLKKP